MKQIIVCADDYGMAPQVDEAILELIENHRISATSCMTLMAGWQQSARQLAPLADKAAFGLHFDLGDTAPLSQLMLRSMLRSADSSAILDTLKKQLDRFEDEMSCAPDYIDGHQHVHAFPQIRDILLTELSRRYHNHPMWIRDPAVPLTGHDSAVKAVAIKLLNYGFQKAIHGAGFTHNNGFAGLYSISEKADFAGMMEGWLTALRHQGLIMCHPATAGSDVEHAAAREKEYAYLMSDRYKEYLLQANIHLTNFKSHH